MVKVTVVYSSRKMRFSLSEDDTLIDLKKIVRLRNPEIVPMKFSFKISPITGKVNMKSRVSDVISRPDVNARNTHWQDVCMSKKHSESNSDLEYRSRPEIKTDPENGDYLFYIEAENPHTKKKSCVIQ